MLRSQDRRSKAELIDYKYAYIGNQNLARCSSTRTRNNTIIKTNSYISRITTEQHKSEMYALHIVLLLTAVMSQMSAKTQIANYSLTYECTKEGSIVITGNGTELYGSIYAVGIISNGSHSMCTVDRSVTASVVTFTISKCNVSQPVIITVMQESQNTTYDMVIGGRNVTMYELKCNNIRRGGLIITHTIIINETNKLTINETHQKEVNMQIKLLGKGGSQSGSIPAFVIGEEIQLIIEGNGGFAFLASSCNATDGTNNPAHTKNLIVNGTSQDNSVISSFSNSGNVNHTELRTTLYAFHFLNTNTISLICTITVCQDDDSSCPFKTQDHRGKRSANLEPQTNTLETSFIVIDSYTNPGDKPDDSNKSGSSSGRISVTASLILFAAFGFARILQ